MLDKVVGKKELALQQYWHLNPEYVNVIQITTTDENGIVLKPMIEEKWFSGYYGFKEKSVRYTFETTGSTFKTSIKIKL